MVCMVYMVLLLVNKRKMQDRSIKDIEHVLQGHVTRLKYCSYEMNEIKEKELFVHCDNSLLICSFGIANGV